MALVQAAITFKIKEIITHRFIYGSLHFEKDKTIMLKALYSDSVNLFLINEENLSEARSMVQGFGDSVSTLDKLNTMTLFKLNKLFFALLILFCAYCETNAQNFSNSGIRGVITNLTRFDSGPQPNKLLGSIMVEREANTGSNIDKADVKILKETRIFAQADKNKGTPLQFDAIKLKQRVEVRFTSEPALLTYPMQVGAAEIIILSGASGSTQKSVDSFPNTAPPTSNTEMTKVRRAIDDGNAVWVAAWAKGDAAMLPDTFTADGKELIAGGKVYKGRKQIFALMRDSMKKRGGRAKLTVTTTDVWLDGNFAYETGTAVYEFITIEDQSQKLERRYFTVWKRQSKRDAWKIYSNTGIAKE